MRYVRAIILSGICGNPSFDAKGALKNSNDLAHSAWNMMEYVSGRKASSSVENAVELFKTLQKNVSKEDIRKEYDRIAGRKKKETPVLGGSGGRRELKPIAKPPRPAR